MSDIDFGMNMGKALGTNFSSLVKVDDIFVIMATTNLNDKQIAKYLREYSIADYYGLEFVKLRIKIKMLMEKSRDGWMANMFGEAMKAKIAELLDEADKDAGFRNQLEELLGSKPKK